MESQLSSDAGLPSLDGPRLRALPAGRELVDQLQDCIEGAADFYERTEGHPPSPHEAEALVAEAEADELRRVFALVPAMGGAAVGVLDLYLHHPEPGVAHLGLLLFREACQALGYGRETVGTLERALANAGFTALRVSVTDENAAARGFWDHLGFEDVGRLDSGVTVLEKRLG